MRQFILELEFNLERGRARQHVDVVVIRGDAERFGIVVHQ